MILYSILGSRLYKYSALRCRGFQKAKLYTMGLKYSKPQFYSVPNEISLEVDDCQIVQVLPGDAENIKKLINVITIGFAGTERTSPVGGIEWVYSGDVRKGKHFTPLSDKPSKERLKMIEWLVKWNLYVHALDSGGCFVLLDKSTKDVVGGAITIPRYTKTLSADSWTEYYVLLRKAGFPGCMPLDRLKRLSALIEAISNIRGGSEVDPYWYIKAFAIMPNMQGKRYGKGLVQFLGSCADAENLEQQLETSSERSIGFYTKSGGFEVVSTSIAKTSHESFEDFGGVHGMARKPNKSSTSVVQD